VFAWRKYSAAEKAGKKTAEAKLELQKKWISLRRFIMTAGIFTCSASTNSSMKEIGAILHSLSAAFRDAMTLGTCMDEIVSVFDDDVDFPIKRAETADQKPKRTRAEKRVAAAAARAAEVSDDSESESDDEEVPVPSKPAPPKALKPKAPKPQKPKESEDNSIDDEALATALEASKKISERRRAAQGGRVSRPAYIVEDGHDSGSEPDTDDELDPVAEKVERARKSKVDIKMPRFHQTWREMLRIDAIKRFFSPLTYGHNWYADEAAPSLMMGAMPPVEHWWTAPMIWTHEQVSVMHSFFSDWWQCVRNVKLPFATTVVISAVALAALVSYLKSPIGKLVKRLTEGGHAKRSKGKAGKANHKSARNNHNPHQGQQKGNYKKNKFDKDDERAADRAEDESLGNQGPQESDFQVNNPGEMMDRPIGSSFTGSYAKGVPKGQFKSRRNGEASNCYHFYKTGKCPTAECPFPHVAGPPRSCPEWVQTQTCGFEKKYGKCKLVHPVKSEVPQAAPVVKKAEHLLPGKPVIDSVKLIEIKSVDRSGRTSRCNAFVMNDAIIVPRHAVAGKSSVSILQGGNEFVLGAVVYVSALMPDQMWFKVPKGMKAFNNSRVFREPVSGETVIIQWLDNGKACLSAGLVGEMVMLGKDRKVKAYDFHASTKNGACGAVYVALKDNAVVGFHGIGAESVKVVPQFYAANLGYMQELKDWSHQTNVKFSEDATYPSEHDDMIQIINGKHSVTGKMVEIPAAAALAPATSAASSSSSSAAKKDF